MATVTSSKRQLTHTSNTYESNGDVTIGGNLNINGTTTTIDTANLLVEDKNIVIGDVSSPSDTTADGGGITLKGATDKTLTWVNSTDAWTFNQNLTATGYIHTDSNLSATGNLETNGTFILNTISAQNSEATALVINGSGLVGTRELGSNAFNSTSFLRSDAADTATGLLTLNGGVHILSGTGGGKLRIKRSSHSTDGDDITDIHMGDSGIFFDIDNDNDNDTANVTFRYKTSGSFTNTLVWTTSGISYKGNTIWHAGNDGSGSGLDADLLDGNHASAFATASHSHAASDITSGTLATARIPSLAASKITSGTLADARIPSLSASKITSGTLSTDRIPDTLELGDTDSTAQGILKLSAYVANKESILQTTNGNLHIDSASGHQTYINYYTGSGITFGNGNTGASGASISTGGIIYATGGNSTNWNTAYTDRNKWDGGSTGLNASTGRTSLGLGSAATSNTSAFAAAGDENIIDGATSIWNADGDGDVFTYNDSNPIHNSKSTGAVIYIRGDGTNDHSLVRAGIFTSDHISTANGYYVGTLLGTGNSTTTQVINSSGAWTGSVIPAAKLSTATTQSSSDNSTKIATTAFVKAQSYLTTSGKAADSEKLDNLDSLRFPYALTGSLGSTNTFVTDGGIGADNITRSMFYRDNGNQFGTIGFNAQHATSTAYSWQMASTSYSNASSIQARVKNNGTWSSPVTIWNSGNDGSGSGLDADTLDGYEGSYYATTNDLSGKLNTSGGTMTGTITSRDIKLGSGYHLQRSNHHSGHLEGSYNNIGANGDKSNPIYTIGSSYNPNDAALSNMYGIGYCNASASFISLSGASGWGQYVAADGDARIFLGGGNGVISSTGEHYVGSQRVHHDGYHPNADTLTTARTIALSGAVTGSASFNGGSNITIATTATADPTLTLSGDASGSATFTNLGNATLSVTVANDSHTHDGRYYTETESDTRFLRSNANDTVTGEITGSGDPSLSGFFLPQNPEGRHVKAPWFFNDMAYARLKGATISVTVTGGSSPSNANIDAMFDASIGFWNMATSGVTEVVIEITNPPKAMSYGSHMGVTFGNTTWRAKDVKLESYYNGQYNELLDVSNQSKEYVTTSYNSSSNAQSKLRWTFSNFNSTSMRIVSLFAYNYNAAGMPSLYLTNDGGTMYGDLTIDTGGASTDALTIKGTSPAISFIDDTSSADDFYLMVDSHNFYVLRDTAGANNVGSGWDTPHPLQLEGDTNVGYLFGNRIFADNYHPNADTLTTARTIALSGAVTGSASFNGSSNITIATTATADPTLTLSGDASGSATFTNLGNATLSVTVANDSHTHDGRYYTETETNGFLNLKANLASPALTGSPTAPTPSLSDNTTKLATTEYVKGQGYVTTDTNTTYSAGRGLDLSGTEFQLETDLRDSISYIGYDSNDYIQWSNNSYFRAVVNGGERFRVNTSGIDVNGTVIGSGFQTDTSNTAYNLITRNSTSTTLYVQAAQSNSLQTIASFRYGSATPNQGTETFRIRKSDVNVFGANFTVGGSITGNSKNFSIPHPTKEGKRLVHSCLEGPEIGVYFRGRSTSATIEMPDYWDGLVHLDSMTVELTAIGPNQDLYVADIADDGDVTVASNTETALNYFYVIYGERKDLERLEVEIDDTVEVEESSDNSEEP